MPKLTEDEARKVVTDMVEAVKLQNNRLSHPIGKAMTIVVEPKADSEPTIRVSGIGYGTVEEAVQAICHL